MSVWVVMFTWAAGMTAGLLVVFAIIFHRSKTDWERHVGNRQIKSRMSKQVGRGVQPEKLVKVCRPENMRYGWVVITVTRRSKVSYKRVVPEGLRVRVEWVPFRWVADRLAKR